MQVLVRNLSIMDLIMYSTSDIKDKWALVGCSATLHKYTLDNRVNVNYSELLRTITSVGGIHVTH